MQDKGESGTKSSLTRFIEKIPVPVKAIVLGIVVYAIGSFPSLAAISFIPFPFSVIALFLILFLYLKYFSGRWGNKDSSSVKFRIENFRSLKLVRKVWIWGVIGALLIVAVQQSMFVVSFRIFEYNPDVMITFQLEEYPRWFLWMVSIASALIAGISEEVGFRGYMQFPLEKKYKPWVANIIVSVVFLLFHLNQGWAQPSLYALLFLLSYLIGMIVIASGSLIPGIIAHFVTDIFNFSFWWSDLAGKFENKPIAETGIDTHFLVWILVFLISLGLFLLVAAKINKEHAFAEKEFAD